MKIDQDTSPEDFTNLTDILDYYNEKPKVRTEQNIKIDGPFIVSDFAKAIAPNIDVKIDGLEEIEKELAEKTQGSIPDMARMISQADASKLYNMEIPRKPADAYDEIMLELRKSNPLLGTEFEKLTKESDKDLMQSYDNVKIIDSDVIPKDIKDTAKYVGKKISEYSPDFLKKSVKSGMEMFKSFGPAVDSFVKAIGADEAAITGTMRESLGLPRKKEFLTNTYGSLIDDIILRKYEAPTEGQMAAAGIKWRDNRLLTVQEITEQEIKKQNDRMLGQTVGFALSIFASPSTYLTAGTSAASKFGTKGLRFTSFGQKHFDDAVKTMSEMRILTEEGVRGAKLSVEEANEIKRLSRVDAENMVMKQFGEVNEVNKMMEIHPEIASMPETAVRNKGVRLSALGYELPLTPGQRVKKVYKDAAIIKDGETLVEGEKVAAAVSKSLLPQATRALKTTLPGLIKTTEKITESIVDTTNEAVRAASEFSTGFVDVMISESSRLKELKAYMVKQGDNIPKLLADDSLGYTQAERTTAYMSIMFDQSKKLAIESTKRNAKFAKNYFSGMSNKQQREFSDLIIRESTESQIAVQKEIKALESAGVEVTDDVVEGIVAKNKKQVFHEDPTIQKYIDRHLGQGKWEGRAFQDRLADKSKLLEPGRLPIHWPGIIDEYVNRIKFKMPKDIRPEERAFLTAREIKIVESQTTGAAKYEVVNAKNYSRDPGKAMFTRLQQISFANLQDEMFQGFVKKGLIVDDIKGVNKISQMVKDPTTGKMVKIQIPNPIEAMAKGYRMVKPPSVNIALLKQEDFAKTYTETKTFFIKNDQYESYRRLSTQEKHDFGVIGDMLDLVMAPPVRAFKSLALTPWPSFHARNFNGNIIMNAYHIGTAALNPWAAEQRAATRASIEAGVYPSKTMEKFFKFSGDMILGKMDSKFVTATGEELTPAMLLKEGTEAGAFKGGYFKSDIGGINLKGDVGEVWSQMLAEADPIRHNGKPWLWGRRLGDAIETQARMVNYSYWRMRGLSPTAAANEVNVALFDYTALTANEKLISRTVIPFYAFAKKNLTNHMFLMKNNPKVITTQLKWLRDMGPSSAELDAMKEQDRRAFTMRFRGAVYGGFGLPLEDALSYASDPGGKLTSSLSPYLRYGFEKFKGEDFFTNRNLDELNYAGEFQEFYWMGLSNKTPAPLRKMIREFNNVIDLQYDDDRDKYSMNPDMRHLLSILPTARGQSTLGQMNKNDRGAIERAFQFFIGIRRIDKDPELVNAIEIRKAQKEASKSVTKENPMVRQLPFVKFFSSDKKLAEEVQSLYEELRNTDSEQERKMILMEIKQLSKENKVDWSR